MHTHPHITGGRLAIDGWQSAWAQIQGPHHPLNEDRLALRPVQFRHEAGYALFAALADGVGGGARGEVAAQALAEHAVALHPADYLRAAAIVTWMRDAESVVRTALDQVTVAAGAATLAAAWLGADGRGHLMRVGDARLYLLDPRRLQRLTEDQTYAHTGELPPLDFTFDDCARMVGSGHMGAPEVDAIALDDDACLLLASDGLHKGLDDSALHAHLLATLDDGVADLEAAARQLCAAARQAGSEDDISALLIRRVARPRARGWERLRTCIGF